MVLWVNSNHTHFDVEILNMLLRESEATGWITHRYTCSKTTSVNISQLSNGQGIPSQLKLLYKTEYNTVSHEGNNY